MTRLITLGLLSGFFFSSTFLLNRMMSVDGGHWLWSASLRYFFMILFLLIGIYLLQGKKVLVSIFKLYQQYWLFWTVAGSIGFGFFYALICYSASYAPAWVIASTWQFTIIASLFVLMMFGRKFPKRVWFFSLMIVVGVCMINLSHISHPDIPELAKGALPVLIATFCYPFGNQLIWEAKHGNRYFPQINTELLHNTFTKVMLLSLGSVPFWVVLVLVIQPSAPHISQVYQTACVALFSGIIATSLFLLARHHATSSTELAAVDATQASEVIFALLGEVFFLGVSMPTLQAWIGIGLVFTGLFLYIFFQAQKEEKTS